MIKNDKKIIIGAIDAITARYCSKSADYIWASSFVMSNMLGKKDDGIINMREFLPLINALIKGSKKPVILDFDIGGRNFQAYKKNLFIIKNLKIGGICIEDEKWPKKNAILRDNNRKLISPQEMAKKILIAKKILDKKIIIARTHSLINKEPFALLKKRVVFYSKSGADVICLHYTGKSWSYYGKIINKLDIQNPLMIILSVDNYNIPKHLLLEKKIKFILFPNQIYRMMLHPLFNSKINNKGKLRVFAKSNLLNINTIFKYINEIA